MKCMHTRLPDFLAKAAAAAKKINPDTEVVITGFESMKSAKLASLRVGRIEEEIVELTSANPKITKVEVTMIPRIAETINTVIIKGVEADGRCPKAIMDTMFLTQPGEEVYLEGVEEISDRRAPLD